MFEVHGNLAVLVAGIAIIGAVAMRTVDGMCASSERMRTNHGLALVARVFTLGVVAAAILLVLGTKVGSVAYAAEQAGAGFGELMNVPMDLNPPDF